MYQASHLISCTSFITSPHSSPNVASLPSLVLSHPDRYALSLANNVFAYRRDTNMLSTFAQSAQRMSGHTEKPTPPTAPTSAAPVAPATTTDTNSSGPAYPNFLPNMPNMNGYGGGVVLHGQGSRGFQLVPRGNGLAWRDF